MVTMSRARYLALLRRKHGSSARLPKSQSGPEQRYFDGILMRRGAYEGTRLQVLQSEPHFYTPDFVVTDGGVVVYHEVKGSYRLQSQDAARLRWVRAAELNPRCVFVWAKEQRRRGVWDVEVWFDGGDVKRKRKGVTSLELDVESKEVRWQQVK